MTKQGSKCQHTFICEYAHCKAPCQHTNSIRNITSKPKSPPPHRAERETARRPSNRRITPCHRHRRRHRPGLLAYPRPPAYPYPHARHPGLRPRALPPHRPRPQIQAPSDLRRRQYLALTLALAIILLNRSIRLRVGARSLSGSIHLPA